MQGEEEDTGEEYSQEMVVAEMAAAAREGREGEEEGGAYGNTTRDESLWPEFSDSEDQDESESEGSNRIAAAVQGGRSTTQSKAPQTAPAQPAQHTEGAVALRNAKILMHTHNHTCEGAVAVRTHITTHNP